MIAIAGFALGGAVMVALVAAPAFALAMLRSLAARLAFTGFHFSHHCRHRHAAVAALIAVMSRTFACSTIRALRPVAANGLGALIAAVTLLGILPLIGAAIIRAAFVVTTLATRL